MFLKNAKWFAIISISLLVFLIYIISTSPDKNIKQKNAITDATTTFASTSEEKEVVVIKEVATQKVEDKPVVKSTPVLTDLYTVTQVVDGDTVKVSIDGKVVTIRLIGIDTPETVDPRKEVQCFGKEVSNKAKELLIGKKIKLEKDPTQGELDKYGRTLAYIIREDGLFYNKYMIEQGYAHEYTYNIPYKYQTEFKSAQKTAQDNQAGLWNPNTCVGNTASALKTQTPTSSQTASKYYTSSASNATKYYPDTCPDWQNLSKSNLKAFNSLEELLAVYPNRTLSSQCQ